MNDLRTLSEFIDKIEEYVIESENDKRGLKLIFAYNDFLNQPIKEDMFTTEKPLFPGFIKCSQVEAVTRGIKKSFDNFGENEFCVCIYEKRSKENHPCYITSFHLKNVSDLVGKIDEYNSENKDYGWSDVF